MSSSPSPLRLAGFLGLVAALVASAMLVAGELQLFGEKLPGCGEGSDCAAVTSGPWGSIPVPGTAGWPVSFMGFAFFAALAAGWLAVRQGRPPRLLVLPGVAVSLLLLGVMATEGAFCVWCVTAHVGNLLFAASTWSARPAEGSSGGLVPAASTFVLATAVLAVASSARTDVLEQRGEERLAVSTAAILLGPDGTEFSGRWVYGPADAPIRLVLFTDYQCPDCRIVEGEAMGMALTRDDLSLSVKHFPLSKACQPSLTKDRHPNACKAARAAEAVGMLAGNDAFWKLHRWLFDMKGEFSDEQLDAQLQHLGHGVGAVRALMDDPRTLVTVQGDIAEAKALGLRTTPMVFINGVELKELGVSKALTRAVNALSAALAAGQEPVHVMPPAALEKTVLDWAEQSVRELGVSGSDWTRGAADPAVDVVVWGDYGQALTRDLHAELSRLLASADDVRYVYRHYPLEKACREVASWSGAGCAAPGAAEAAGLVGGPKAFWEVHARLMASDDPGSAATLRAAADAAGLSVDVLTGPGTGPQASAAVAEDVAAGRAQQLNVVPGLFVNGRWVPRWRLKHAPDAPVLEMVLQAAREGR